MPVRVEALDHLVINVADVAVTAEWYRKILGMEVKVFDPGGGKAPRTSLQFGNQKINVRPRDADKVEWFTADHQTAGSEDLCFLTSAAPDEVVAHLKAHGVAIEEGPVPKQGARGTLRSVYCRDPDGSLIEISSYADGGRQGHAAHPTHRHCERSEAIQNPSAEGRWITSSQGLLAMTAERAVPAPRFAPRVVQWQEDAIIKKQPPARCRLHGEDSCPFNQPLPESSARSTGSTCHGS